MPKSFSENCYRFFKQQQSHFRTYTKLHNFEIEPVSKKNLRTRVRLPVQVAKVLIYFLEINRGKTTELEKLRAYLSDGRLKKDLEKIKEALQKGRPLFNRYSEKGVASVDIKIPIEITKLLAHKAEATPRWRAIWIHDLYRLVHAAHRNKIEKQLPKHDKEVLRKKIMSEGAISIRKRKNKKNRKIPILN
jgi:hypothetical protein